MAAHENFEKLIGKSRTASGPERQTETAKYMTDMLLEMRNIAERQEMKFLTYLLEMAYYEAFSVANKVDLSAGDVEKLREVTLQSRNAPKPSEPSPQAA